MYTVYCYAYYFTIKGTKVGNSGLCVTTRDGISRSTSTLTNASQLFLLMTPISLNEDCLQFILGSTSIEFIFHKTTAGEETLRVNSKYSSIPFRIFRF